ncbi:MAG: response regulator transcription factor [Acidimicrobiales bacterium]
MARRTRTLVLLEPIPARRAATVLARAGHDVRIGAVSAAPQLITTIRPDLVIVAVTSDDPAHVRAAMQRVHVAHRPLVLCLANGPDQWIPALDAGADAHLQRPFDAEELESTVTALIRRAPWLRRTEHCVGRLLVDEDAHLAVFDDQALTLCKKEFGILALLAKHAGSVLSKRMLLEQLWSYDAYDENLVEVHVSSLRRHLPPEARQLIQTVRGLGYVLRQDSAQGASA